MYFKESDRIANKERFPRSVIEKIDHFLARRASSEFKIQDVRDFAEVYENVEEILDNYIKSRVLKPKPRYYCPLHPNKAVPLQESVRFSKKGYCNKCDKKYSFHGLAHEVIYKRIRNPRLWSDSLSSNLTGQPKQPWWKDKKWVITSFIAFAAVVVAFLQWMTCNESINVVLPSTEGRSLLQPDETSDSDDALARFTLSAENKRTSNPSPVSSPKAMTAHTTAAPSSTQSS